MASRTLSDCQIEVGPELARHVVPCREAESIFKISSVIFPSFALGR
jgi:hypothetical protein